ncbi:hypothetical protein E2320_000815, partial [Naja naja]
DYEGLDLEMLAPYISMDGDFQLSSTDHPPWLTLEAIWEQDPPPPPSEACSAVSWTREISLDEEKDLFLETSPAKRAHNHEAESFLMPSLSLGFLLSVEECLDARSERGTVALGKKLLALEEPMGLLGDMLPFVVDGPALSQLALYDGEEEVSGRGGEHFQLGEELLVELDQAT